MGREQGKTGHRRLLAIGDASNATGFGRVMRAVLAELQSDYEIHQLGVNLWTDAHDLPWHVYPTDPHTDMLGTTRLASLAETVQPDLVLCVTDLWVHQNYLEVLEPLRSSFRLALYTPIDGGPLDPELFVPLDAVDEFVVYTEFARRECERACDQVRAWKPEFRMPRMRVIPHGVDTETFHALGADSNGPPTTAERQAVIDSLYGDRPGFEGAFIVLNANRNQPRKRIDITMKAFAAFARDKPPSVKLHLHMGSEDLGWHIPRMARRLGILDRLILTNRNTSIPGVPDETLNRIYNSAAVGLNTATGEGWGLVAFEHAATGAAQIVPAHTACEELWAGSGLLVEPTMYLTSPGSLFEGGYVTPEDTAAALQRLYDDEALRDATSAACWANAHRPEYGWAGIGESWRAVLDERVAP